MCMESLKERIGSMDGEELNEVLSLVTERYTALFPGWTMHVISLEKGRSREEQIDGMIRLLNRMKQD